MFHMVKIEATSNNYQVYGEKNCQQDRTSTTPDFVEYCIHTIFAFKI